MDIRSLVTRGPGDVREMEDQDRNLWFQYTFTREPVIINSDANLKGGANEDGRNHRHTHVKKRDDGGSRIGYTAELDIRPIIHENLGNWVPLFATGDARMQRWLRPEPGVECTDPAIVDLAGKVTEARHSGDLGKVLRTVHRIIHSRITYRLQRGELGARAGLEKGEGDCTEFASLATALLRAAGIPARVVFSLTPPSGRHALTDVFYNGTFIPVDLTPTTYTQGIPWPNVLLMHSNWMLATPMHSEFSVYSRQVAPLSRDPKGSGKRGVGRGPRVKTDFKLLELTRGVGMVDTGKKGMGDTGKRGMGDTGKKAMGDTGRRGKVDINKVGVPGEEDRVDTSVYKMEGERDGEGLTISVTGSIPGFIGGVALTCDRRGTRHLLQVAPLGDVGHTDRGVHQGSEHTLDEVEGSDDHGRNEPSPRRFSFRLGPWADHPITASLVSIGGSVMAERHIPRSGVRNGSGG